MLSGKQGTHRALSPSHEHYLRAIWELRARAGYARQTDVARELGVTHATLSVGLKALEERGLVGHDDHRFLVLTPAGERAAREVHHRFAVLRVFLAEVLGVEAAAAEREACLIEHDISAQTTERFVDLLKLLHEDPELRRVLQERLTHTHGSCERGEACATCGLSCLTA
jgi:DtxR family Mn-dependent transcriptional regulator